MIEFTKCKCKVEKGKFDINNIPLNCPAVWQLIAGGHTIGIFQLEKNLGQDWAKRVKPNNIEELAALVSLLRPGPLECIGENTSIIRRRDTRGTRKYGCYNHRISIQELYKEYCALQKHYIKMRMGGENNPGSKLSQDEVDQIQQLLNNNQLMQKEIAKIFGVTQGTISRIKLGKSYNRNKIVGDEITNKLNIISMDIQSGKLVNNKIKAVIPKGRGSVYSIKIRTSWTFTSQAGWLNIRATKNHFFRTKNEWKKLKDIQSGDYIAIFTGKRPTGTRKDNSGKNIPGYKNFRNIAFYNWEYHCACCNWSEASLDVNHLDGNRKTNNNSENLVWLCPNHHRMYTEGKLSNKHIIQMREKYRLPPMSDTRFVRVEEIKYEGEENLYDIAVEGPHNNYLAGNYVVHNSGMSQDYADIKFGRKKSTYLHPSLKPILESTYGCLVYQEQALRIATDIAGFSPENADSLRKSIGKKDAKLMASLKDKFITGCQKHSKIGRGIAEEIFGWIEKCQRYSFNKSHALSYGMIAYQTAWLKCHFPHEFFTSYLTFSQYKGDPKEEIYKLVQDARLFGVDIFPPDIRRGNIHFQMLEEPQKGVAFGLAHIRGVGTSSIQKIVTAAKETPGTGSLNTWANFLAAVPDFHRNVGIALIKSGACDYYNMERSEMVRELEVILGTTAHDSDGKKIAIKGLTSKEKIYFFDQLQQGAMTTREILLQMSQPPGNKIKTIGQMIKKELIEAAIAYLDQAGVAFDGIMDGESKFVHTSSTEKEIWLKNLKNRTKKEIEELMLQNGYKDISIKPPCSSDARRRIIVAKAKMLENSLTDTNTAIATAERHFLGIALSCSPADDADDSLATHTCLEVATAPNKEAITVCVIIDNVKYTKTKRGRNPGQSMAFLTISDSTYSIDHSVIFPDAFGRLKGLCKEDLICLIYGEKRNGSFIVSDIQKLI